MVLGDTGARDAFPLGHRWLAAAPCLREQFEKAHPFPLLVLDDFLDAELAADLVAEFPPLDAMPRSRDYIFANKHQLASIERAGPAGARVHALATSQQFRAFLVAATGIHAFVDPSFFGGGFHQAGDGGFHDVHLDATFHPLHPTWRRALNVLVYLNRDWRDEYGGQLLLKASPEEEPLAIAPLFNRAVIMQSDTSTYHGFRPMRLPAGVTRKFIGIYCYREDDEPFPAHTTRWVPEDPSLFKRVVARYYDRAVQTKNRWFGTGTARNR